MWPPAKSTVMPASCSTGSEGTIGELTAPGDRTPRSTPVRRPSTRAPCSWPTTQGQPTGTGRSSAMREPNRAVAATPAAGAGRGADVLGSSVRPALRSVRRRLVRHDLAPTAGLIDVCSTTCSSPRRRRVHRNAQRDRRAAGGPETVTRSTRKTPTARTRADGAEVASLPCSTPQPEGSPAARDIPVCVACSAVNPRLAHP
jgi:hypothetical protein